MAVGFAIAALLASTTTGVASAKTGDAEIPPSIDPVTFEPEGPEIVGKEELFRTSPEMLAYDKAVAEAMVEADRLTADALKRDPKADPIPPDLPDVAFAASGEKTTIVPLPPNTAPGPSNESSSRAACSGNCYQTDSTAPTANLPAGTYAFDYWMWLGNPQNNETNGCDGSGSGNCFWFQASQYDMDFAGAGFHVGPQRGSSIFGNAADDWHLSHSGYNAPNSGSPTGAVCTTSSLWWCVDDDEIPTGTWVRVRVWRLATTHTPGYGWSSKWGSWAQWGGTDHAIGTNLWMRGRTLVRAHQFMEVYETNGQCSTDFERTYFNDPRSLAGSTWTTQPHANANYESNCSNTTWHRFGGEFVRDEREHFRDINQGGFLW